MFRQVVFMELLEISRTLRWKPRTGKTAWRVKLKRILWKFGEIVEWMRPVKDIFQWRALVNATVNLLES
jgi:hypothetical protein